MADKNPPKEARIRAVQQHDGGRPASEICKEMNISPAMLKRWRDQLHLLAPPDAQGWKIDLARQMRDRHGASANWLAKRMRINSGAYLRKLLAQG